MARSNEAGDLRSGSTLDRIKGAALGALRWTVYGMGTLWAAGAVYEVLGVKEG